jgi:hypothetical protein
MAETPPFLIETPNVNWCFQRRRTGGSKADHQRLLRLAVIPSTSHASGPLLVKEVTLGGGLPLLLFAEALVEIGVDHFHETVHTAFEEVVRIGDHGVLDDDALLGLKPLD